jgi:hypothetical protein
MAPSPKVLSIGQCGADTRQIAAMLAGRFGAETVAAATAADARRRLESGGFDLVLVNRILDADGSSGLTFITAHIASGDATPAMLVSDRPDAQQSAIAAGARPGFGKSALHAAATTAAVGAVLRPLDTSAPDSRRQ